MGALSLKKLSYILSVIILLIFCTSCSENIKIPEVRSAVENNAAVRIGNTNYQCHISYVSDNVSSVSFLSPENIKGLTFSKSGNDRTVSLGTLICRNDNSAFSQNCIFGKITSTLAKIKQDNIKFISKKNNLYMFSLKNDPVCKFFTDENGNIKSVSCKDTEMKFD